MAIPTWTVGQVLTASDVNSYFVPIAARKTADESVTSSTTLQNDDHLALTLAATTGTWWLEGMLQVDAGTTGDFKTDWTGPSGTVVSLGWWADYVGSAGGSTEIFHGMQAALTDVVTVGGATVGVIRPIMFQGIVRTTGTSGTLQLRWAQNTSNAASTILKAESAIWARRIQ